MTLPDERTRAVIYARKFLEELSNGTIKRIPKSVRTAARGILRHYPHGFDFDQMQRNFTPWRAEENRWAKEDP